MKKQLLLILFTFIGFSLFAQGNCLDFDGNNDFVNMGDVDELDGIAQMTIEFWVNPHDLTASTAQRLVAKGGSAGDNHRWATLIATGTDELHFSMRTTSGNEGEISTNLNALTLNTWTHVAVVYDGGQAVNIDKVEFYINGREVSDGNKVETGTILTTTPASNSSNLRIAATTTGNAELDGQMDEVRIWTTVRTEAQIRENMYCPFDDPNSETDLEAYYNFNETSGTNLPDQATTNAHDGTLSGNMDNSDWIASGALSTAANGLDFDGTNDRVNLGDIDAMDGVSTLTIEMWFNADDISTNKRLFGKKVDGSNSTEINFSGGNTIVLQVEEGGASFGTFSFTSTNTWHHLAMVFDGGGGTNADRLKGYLDGVQQTLAFTGTIPAATDDNMENAYIGDNGKDLVPFDGTIDDFRIWSTARTTAQIIANLTGEIACSDSDLIAYYKFNQADADAVNTNFTCLGDCTTNLRHGTLTNFGLSGTSSNWVAGTSFSTGLPVELVSFDARENGTDILLTWQTASESQNRGWEIEHSTDAQNWNRVGFTGGRGESFELQSYSFTHETPQPGNNYYRLKQIDYDGAFEYSEVVNVNFAENSRELRVYPNPVSHGELKLILPKLEEAGAQFYVRDYTGKVLLKSQVTASETILDVSSLPVGLYMMEIVIGRDRLWEKVVIQ